MKTTLTVLVDNIASDSLRGEWGLSVLAQYGDTNILVDTGASALFAENMKKLGVSPADVDYAVLSHAHYDHANGMPAFFRENQKARFYLRETAAENCYLKLLFLHKYIGLPKGVLTEYADRIEAVSGDYRLCTGAYLIPHKAAGLEAVGKREKMYLRTDAGWTPDNFSHEQSLVLETESGLVIVNCCSHGGVTNILRDVQAAFPGKHICGFIGGLHLFNKPDAEVRRVAAALADSGIGCICTGHCTKNRAYAVMQEILGERLQQLHVGLTLSF